MAYEIDSFDLTSKDGIKAAMKNPKFYQYFFAYGYVADIARLVKDVVSNSTDINSTIREQTKAAETIIKAARANGAESIELRMDQAAGLQVKGAMGDDSPFNMMMGKDGKMNVKVVFKK